MRPAVAEADADRWLQVDWAPFVHDTRIDGRTVRYVDHGEGPALVLIHGLGGSWQTWLRNLPALADHHRVIGIDLPGFGRSEPLRPPAEMATHADVVALLLEELGIPAATIVGHSMGGLVALLLVERHPGRVERLVLVNAGGIALDALRLAVIIGCFRAFNFCLGRPGPMRALARRPRLRRLVFAGFVPDATTLAGPYAAEVIPTMAAPGFTAALGPAGRAAVALNTDAVTCPVLLIWGAKDRILPVGAARELSRSLLDARLIEIPQAGHCPMFETPGAFDRALLGFTAAA